MYFSFYETMYNKKKYFYDTYYTRRCIMTNKYCHYTREYTNIFITHESVLLIIREDV